MKKNLLLLHAALGSKEQLKALISQLEDHYHVYSMDFEGHGVNESDKEFSIELFTLNVVDFMQENDLECACIFGYSMGGYVALDLARKHPQLVEKIVTFGTKFDWNPETSEKEVKMLNPDIIAAKVPKFAEVLKSAHGEDHWQDVLNKTADMMISLGNSPIHSSENLKEINHKVMITVGDEDHMISIEESKWAAENLPNGSLKIFNGFVHAIERNDIAQLAEFVRANLSN